MAPDESTDDPTSENKQVSGFQWPSKLPEKQSELEQTEVDSESATGANPSIAQSQQPNNPLHGVKLADILEYLVQEYGWEELGFRINVRCFNINPSIKSSLKFLRRNQWARDQVERLYLRSIA